MNWNIKTLALIKLITTNNSYIWYKDSKRQINVFKIKDYCI